MKTLCSLTIMALKWQCWQCWHALYFWRRAWHNVTPFQVLIHLPLPTSTKDHITIFAIFVELDDIMSLWLYFLGSIWMVRKDWINPTNRTNPINPIIYAATSNFPRFRDKIYNVPLCRRDAISAAAAVQQQITKLPFPKKEPKIPKSKQTEVTAIFKMGRGENQVRFDI